MFQPVNEVSFVPVSFLPPATKLGQGYIFTGVCDSVRGGAGPRGVPGPGVPGLGGGVCSRREGLLGGDFPPGRLLLRAVRILSECILVHFPFSLKLILKNVLANLKKSDPRTFELFSHIKAWNHIGSVGNLIGCTLLTEYTQISALLTVHCMYINRDESTNQVFFQN